MGKNLEEFLYQHLFERRFLGRRRQVRKTQKLGAGGYIKKPYTIYKIGRAVKDELLRLRNLYKFYFKCGLKPSLDADGHCQHFVLTL